MSFDCNAPFIAYSLLSTFPTITENERDAVQVILELLPCYDVLSKELRVTHEAHVVAQILLDELRTMARRHSYVQEGTLEDITEAHELLNVIVLPLVYHLSESEYNEIRRTIEEADKLLSNPLELLNELLTLWRLCNLEVMSEWYSRPIEGFESYYFGANLPNGAKLEELLTPLPYPTKLHSNDLDSTEDEGLERTHERRRKRQARSRASEFGKPRAVPRSECSRELALKSKPKSKSKHFFLPRFTSSHTSSETAHDSGDHHSDSSRSHEGHFRRYPNFVERGGEIECLCETGRVCVLHPEGQPSDYEVNVKLPRRRRLVNLVKTAVKRM